MLKVYLFRLIKRFTKMENITTTCVYELWIFDAKKGDALPSLIIQNHYHYLAFSLSGMYLIRRTKNLPIKMIIWKSFFKFCKIHLTCQIYIHIKIIFLIIGYYHIRNKWLYLDFLIERSWASLPLDLSVYATVLYGTYSSSMFEMYRNST